MNKRKYSKMVVCLLIVNVFLLYMHADYARAATKEGSVDVGRGQSFREN